MHFLNQTNSYNLPTVKRAFAEFLENFRQTFNGVMKHK